MEYDLKALQRVGVTTLVTLTETALDETRLTPFGLKSILEPIPDMAAPTVETRHTFVPADRTLAGPARSCRSPLPRGIGRTGTVLAASLIWDGNAHSMRWKPCAGSSRAGCNRKYKFSFLEEFESAVAKNHAESVPD